MATGRERVEGERAVGILLGVALMLAPASVAAEGERTPMVGGAVIGAAANEDALAGVVVEAAWSLWRFGLSAEGSMMWSADAAARRVAVLGLSARLLVFDTRVQSLFEPRDVELGIELQGIVERAWWSQTPAPDANRYGIGVAVRLRGASDYDMSSLLAESRVFVRLMTSHTTEGMAIARMLTPPKDRDTGELMIVFGVGAAWGRGDPDYLERFRMEPFSPAAQRLAAGWFE
jgi:hypothetical protein